MTKVFSLLRMIFMMTMHIIQPKLAQFLEGVHKVNSKRKIIKHI